MCRPESLWGMERNALHISRKFWEIMHWAETLHSGAFFFCRIIEVDKKSDKKWRKKEDVQPRKWCTSQKFFHAFFFCKLLVFHETLILQWAARKTNPRAYQCIWDSYIKFAQKYYNFTTSSKWVVYRYMCVSKNAILSKDAIFYFLWYNVIRSSHIQKIFFFLIS